jgi:hypothetical protein
MNRIWSSPRQDQLYHTSGNTRTWVVKSLGTLGCRARGLAGQHTVQAISSNSKRLKQDEMKQESRLKEYTYIHTYTATTTLQQQQHCNSNTATATQQRSNGNTATQQQQHSNGNTATATQQRQQQQHGNSNNTATTAQQQQQHGNSNTAATTHYLLQHTTCTQVYQLGHALLPIRVSPSPITPPIYLAKPQYLHVYISFLQPVFLVLCTDFPLNAPLNSPHSHIIKLAPCTSKPTQPLTNAHHLNTLLSPLTCTRHPAHPLDQHPASASRATKLPQAHTHPHTYTHTHIHTHT